jgi:hypothetical protein
MSTLSDKANDFWDRISPRERRLVVIAAIAVPLTLAIWLGLSIRDGLVAIEHARADAQGAKRARRSARTRQTARKSTMR